MVVNVCLYLMTVGSAAYTDGDGTYSTSNRHRLSEQN